MEYKEIDGNLIQFAYAGIFDVITHGCNCFCTMGAGIAIEMNKHFRCNDPSLFKLEHPKQRGNINKLGCIEGHELEFQMSGPGDSSIFTVVNSYTQYHYGKAGYQNGRFGIPLDYNALQLCMHKINQKYPGKHLGLPTIGCSHGGGNWARVSEILNKELKDMSAVTVVKFIK